MRIVIYFRSGSSFNGRPERRAGMVFAEALAQADERGAPSSAYFHAGEIKRPGERNCLNEKFSCVGILEHLYHECG